MSEFEAIPSSLLDDCVAYIKQNTLKGFIFTVSYKLKKEAEYANACAHDLDNFVKKLDGEL